jgi:hypothetical protein
MCFADRCRDAMYCVSNMKMDGMYCVSKKQIIDYLYIIILYNIIT